MHDDVIADQARIHRAPCIRMARLFRESPQHVVDMDCRLHLREREDCEVSALRPEWRGKLLGSAGEKHAALFQVFGQLDEVQYSPPLQSSGCAQPYSRSSS